MVDNDFNRFSENGNIKKQKCSTCKEVKPIVSFSPSQRRKGSCRCKTCSTNYAINNKKKNNLDFYDEKFGNDNYCNDVFLENELWGLK